MQGNDTHSKIGAYLRTHWFQFGLGAILLFVVFKKDLSFQINLNAPDGIEEEESSQPVRRKDPERKREIFTEKASETTPPAGEVSRMELTPLSFGSASKTYLQRLAAVDDADKRAYLTRFAQVAQGEQKKYGVPASVLLATAMLMSQAGSSEPARKGNNHFALHCTQDWKGESGQYSGVCLRHYANAWTSFRDCSLFLTTGPNARLCPDNTNYKEWAKALGNMGFPGGADFPGQLLTVIETFGLQ